MMGQKTANHFTTPAAVVDQARHALDMRRSLDTVSESLFNTILLNEIGPATSLATRMLGDYTAAARTVHASFEHAKADFHTYDGSESPRAWVLAYVATEVMRQAENGAGQLNAAPPTSPIPAPGPVAGDQFSDGNPEIPASNTINALISSDTEAALKSLSPERKLAVILTDVFGMTDEVAAKISRVDPTTIRHRAAAARSWIARQFGVTGNHSAADGAAG